MAYFEDLTPYTYLNDGKEPPGTVNIGWLEPGYPFPIGVTSEEFRIKLDQLCHRRVNQTRGFHYCGFCATEESPLVGLGSSFEMRVEGGGMEYAAPSLVHHYVVAHGYRPPDGFILAVLAWNETAPRLGQQELWARVSERLARSCELRHREMLLTTRRSSYRIASVDRTAERYEVEYSSGRRFFISSDELYALYRELYRSGSLTNAYMKANARRVLGWSSWKRPGSAIFAILPRIDEGIRDVRGSLCLWWPLVGEPDA